jgi:hypothetical protein
MAKTLADYAKEKNINIGYDANTKNVTLGNQQYTPDQLKSMGGQLVSNRWTFNDTSAFDPKVTVPVPQQTVQAQPMYQQPQIDYSAQLAEAQKQKAIADLKRAYDASTGKLNQTQAQIAPMYEGQRSGFREQSTMRGQSFENFLAQKGLGQSGSSAQGQLAENVLLGGQLSSSQMQQQSEMDNIARQRAQLEADLQYGTASAQSASDIQALQYKMEQQQFAEQRAYQEAQQAKVLQANQADEAFNRQLQTLGAYSNDYAAEINRRMAENPNDPLIPYLQAARQEKIQSQGLDSSGRPLPVNNIPQLTSSSALQLWEQLGVANEAVANALGIKVGDQYRNAVQSGYSGGSGGVGGSGGGIPDPNELTIKERIKWLNDNLRGTRGTQAVEAIMTYFDWGFFKDLMEKEVYGILDNFGVTREMLEQGYNLRDAINSGNIPLPSSGFGGLTTPIYQPRTNTIPQLVKPASGMGGTLNSIR